ncbi:sialidase-3 isoform X1 [Clupea harengus]|uniref:exo-alpha-sialidase n=1 Tax=Clupea harengus TaxID=7950 RepID=A0A6P8GJ86_CLUHA|nr:sialidase-3 isoform X1 [Clupea harengus]
MKDRFTSSGPQLPLVDRQCQPQTIHDRALFEDLKGEYDFRIPALIYVKEGKTFLAFAEKRTVKNGKSNDENAKNLVMRKGTRQADGSLQWSDCKDLMEATKHGYRTMSPCPVYERNTNTLFLFFICIEGEIKEADLTPGQTRLCYVITRDRGETWSLLTDLTDKVNGINLLDYKTFAVGPGHGIAVERGKNGMRLLIPAYVKSTSTKVQPDHALVLYSDDEGQTWQAGKTLFEECGECQVAEVRVTEGTEGTKLYCSARTWGKGMEEVPRLEALSEVTSVDFTKLKSLTLKETPHGCQGSVLGFPASELHPGDKGTMLLFSHPTKGPEEGENGWTRRDLGVRLRESLQGAWGEPYIIHQGKGGYSDLCEDGAHFACLMECGEFPRQRIIFQEFPLSDIPKPAQLDRHDPVPNPSDPVPNPSDPAPNPSDPAGRCPYCLLI